MLSHLRGKTHQQALKHNNNGMSMTKQEIVSLPQHYLLPLLSNLKVRTVRIHKNRASLINNKNSIKCMQYKWLIGI